MRLDCLALRPDPPELRPADPQRDWMDAFPGRHPYRCLPLAIANAHGWEVLSPCRFSAVWDGGDGAEAIRIQAEDGYPWIDHFVTSHFTRGVLTLYPGYLFRTEPGWNLYVSGSPNRPKDGIAPLSAVIETDWLPYPFTMNWMFTTPSKRVVFEKGEPFCFVMPVAKGAIETVEPVIRTIEDDPELDAQYRAWRDRRSEFMTAFDAGDPAALKQAWQRFYFEGKKPDGSVAEGHVPKLRAAVPVDKRRK